MNNFLNIKTANENSFVKGFVWMSGQTANVNFVSFCIAFKNTLHIKRLSTNKRFDAQRAFLPFLAENVSPDEFINFVNAENVHEIYYSSELRNCYLRFNAEKNCVLPTQTDDEFSREIENEISFDYERIQKKMSKDNYIINEIKHGQTASNLQFSAASAYKTFEIEFKSAQNWKRLTNERKQVIFNAFINKYSSIMTRRFAAYVCNEICGFNSDVNFWHHIEFFGELLSGKGKAIGNDKQWFINRFEQAKLLFPSGFTIDFFGDLYGAVKGYAVGVHPLTEKQIFADVEKFFSDGEKGKKYFVGFWKDGETGKEYLDKVLIIENLKDAVYLAKQFQQIAIYDFANDCEIKTK